ncbi:YgaP family membrane protein [Solibacillus sp. FSL H8-0538]|uniref:YgaP family membrane protein n=1 Tax=Solibacillus sp. FSL H8-0538 TaxID=2921400 RepID=UPI0030FCB81E
MLQENISEQNAFIRLICGIALTAFGTGRISRDPHCTAGRLMILAGAMKVAEGIYQYCPITAMAMSTSENEDYSVPGCGCDHDHNHSDKK